MCAPTCRAAGGEDNSGFGMSEQTSLFVSVRSVSGIPVILAAPVFIVSGLGSGRQAVYGDLISRLVDKHPGRYSDSMGVLHQANSWPLDAFTHSRPDSRCAATRHYRPVPQSSAGR